MEKKKAFNSVAAPLKAGVEIGISSHISTHIITEIFGGFNMSNEKMFYIQQITELMEKCADVSLLQLVYQIMTKSM